MEGESGAASFDEADAALAASLAELDAHVPNYNEWLRTLVRPATVGRVLELGAGIGTFTRALLLTASAVVAVEPSARAAGVLRDATRDEPRITVVHGDAADAAAHGPFDGAVLSNVLEHIDDDEATLRQLFKMVRPGGRVAVFSPAFALLMSDFDRSIGHVRRYRRRELTARFERAGFAIVEARYVNAPGFVAWLLVARVLRKRPTRSALSSVYDRVVVPIAQRLESRVTVPFGQSILVIGEVPACEATAGATG